MRGRRLLFHLGGKRLNDENGVAGAAVGVGLLGDEAVAQHGIRGFHGGFRSVNDVNAALKTGVEFAEATATSKNLEEK